MMIKIRLREGTLLFPFVILLTLFAAPAECGDGVATGSPDPHIEQASDNISLASGKGVPVSKEDEKLKPDPNHGFVNGSMPFRETNTSENGSDVNGQINETKKNEIAVSTISTENSGSGKDSYQNSSGADSNMNYSTVSEGIYNSSLNGTNTGNGTSSEMDANETKEPLRTLTRSITNNVSVEASSETEEMPPSNISEKPLPTSTITTAPTTTTTTTTTTAPPAPNPNPNPVVVEKMSPLAHPGNSIQTVDRSFYEDSTGFLVFFACCVGLAFVIYICLRIYRERRSSTLGMRHRWSHLSGHSNAEGSSRHHSQHINKEHDFGTSSEMGFVNVPMKESERTSLLKQRKGFP